ncbi:hypothetical protein SeMB42_g00767 [Synchytrium endobioticum]|uniref:Uncharacterized protein n=1 Tax=Synchytrium endobioticum TaxID=286115 RepID=A0A507CQP9_9FUNG|nr:hypothetical protein SeLEV6574_g06076 [Synchytrium endobioticum]TPX53501.1 hypothetical protein SeMB42_g00767 [Synchytrium endobioticum]
MFLTTSNIQAFHAQKAQTMAMKLIVLVVIAAFTTLVHSCTQDILQDDMRMPRPYTNGTGFNGGPTQQNLTIGVSFNLVDADYGQAGVPYAYANGSMTLTAGVISPVYTPNPNENPNTADTFNYWYTKFDSRACFDATNYSGVEIVGTFPVGVNFNMTFTQKAADCVTRTIDSQYRLLTSYITPNGQQNQVLYVPFADYALNLLGKPYDFVHLKDFTLVNITPRGAIITFNRITVKGTCGAANSTSQETSPNGTASTPRSGSGSWATTVLPNSYSLVSMMALSIDVWLGLFL